MVDKRYGITPRCRNTNCERYKGLASASLAAITGSTLLSDLPGGCCCSHALQCASNICDTRRSFQCARPGEVPDTTRCRRTMCTTIEDTTSRQVGEGCCCSSDRQCLSGRCEPRSMTCVVDDDHGGDDVDSGQCRMTNCKLDKDLTSRGPLHDGCCCSRANQCSDSHCDMRSMTCGAGQGGDEGGDGTDEDGDGTECRMTNCKMDKDYISRNLGAGCCCSLAQQCSGDMECDMSSMTCRDEDTDERQCRTTLCVDRKDLTSRGPLNNGCCCSRGSQCSSSVCSRSMTCADSFSIG